VREAIPFVLLAFACGAALRQRPPAPPRGGDAADAPLFPRETEGPAPGGGGFSSLAAQASVLAAGMREAARAESSPGDRIELVRAEGRDTCVRVAFAASGPVSARLLDGDGRVLASQPAPVTEGALGEHGPVCVRKGDLVAAEAESGDGGAAVAVVRWIGWQAP